MSFYATDEQLAVAARAVASAFAPRPEMQGPPEPAPKAKPDDWRQPGTRRIQPGPRPCRPFGAR